MIHYAEKVRIPNLPSQGAMRLWLGDFQDIVIYGRVLGAPPKFQIAATLWQKRLPAQPLY